MKKFFARPTTQIPPRLLVTPSTEAEVFHWTRIDDGVPETPVTGTLAQLFELQQQLPGSELILMLPAAETSMRTVAVTDAERKLYRQTLPFELEDSLIESTDKLHFAYTSLDGDRMGVVLARRGSVQALIDEFVAAGLGIDIVTPQSMLLPWSAQEQTWLLQDAQVVARTGACAGFVAALDSLELVATMPDAESHPPSEQLNLVAQSGFDSDRLEAVMGKVYPGYVLHNVESALAWQGSVLPEEPLNMLQGDFQPAPRWRHHWQIWKSVAYVALAAVLLNYGVLIYNYSSVKNATQRLEAEKYALAREAIPVGKISSPERQVQAALSQLSNSGPTEFGSMLARVGPALASEAGYTVRTINYDGQGRSLRLELRARDFQHIEQFRTAVQARGLQAQLLNSSAQGQGILARIELKEAGR
jgi:general secretion pathway protein L